MKRNTTNEMSSYSGACTCIINFDCIYRTPPKFGLYFFWHSTWRYVHLKPVSNAALPPRISIHSLLKIYKSDLVFSTPHGSAVRFVNPALFSHDFLPVRGPATGALAVVPAEAAEALRASSSLTVVSGVRSS